MIWNRSSALICQTAATRRQCRLANGSIQFRYENACSIEAVGCPRSRRGRRSSLMDDSSRISTRSPFGISVSRRFDQSSGPLRPSSRRSAIEEITNMFDYIASGRGVVLAAVAAGATLAGLSTSSAGECPAGKFKADARAPVAHAGKGVTDFRKLTIEPGGIVPWHSHGDRPAIIYIAEGEIVEYASNCADPIVHKAGDIRPEKSDTAHWWQNNGNKTAVLFVGDVLHDKTDHNM